MLIACKAQYHGLSTTFRVHNLHHKPYGNRSMKITLTNNYNEQNKPVTTSVARRLSYILIRHDK